MCISNDLILSSLVTNVTTPL